MAGKLEGRRIAFIAADGVEQVELEQPWKAIEEEGATPELISLESGKIQAFQHLDHGDQIKVDKPIEDADPDDYDGLVLPGGVANPDFLRVSDDVIAFIRGIFEQGKPVGVICHGPWTIVEAGLVKGRTLTSWPSLKTDIRNAGGKWIDEEVVVDNGLVTSRKPDDLPAFNAKIIEEFAEGRHERQAAAAGAVSS